MISHDTHLRVRYGETDQMGYAYYGKYAEYFEVGRVELVRKIGIPYKEVEAKGVMMPVSELQVNYKRPAYYDDLLTIRTSVNERPRSYFLFEYEVFNEKEELLATGHVKLAFVNMEKMRPVRAPQFVLEAIDAYIGSKD
ncbi:MAG: acyl-CoA thioesterase [Bacteroidia bacterium]|nr:acyl-CoA thioesterase [Bacteroidia bacterium]